MCRRLGGRWRSAEPAQLSLRLAPAGEHVEFLAAEGDDGHAISRPEVRKLFLQRVEHTVALGRGREEVVDEHEDTGADLVTRDQRRYGERARIRFPRGCHCAPGTDLGEVLDRHLAAVDRQLEVAGFETGDALSVPVSNHDLEVDDTNVEHLSEDVRGSWLLRLERGAP